ncbi:MAG: hypothetical protein JRI23_20855 [Deltaproteobacteria bacterium]|nr:hypothetical protein [Deltaproteobacteria bacterium]MBW2534372.1 hypothetical protein [Deltaproteobacteria bacterium]
MPRLIAAFDRKPPGLDVSRRGASSPRRSALGRSLRSVGRGAADGLAEAGRPAGLAAEQRLLRVAVDRRWHEEVRLAACRALAEVGSDELLAGLVERIRDAARTDELGAICLAETLARRADSTHATGLVALLGEELPAEVQLAVAGAIGSSGVGWDHDGYQAERSLVAMLDQTARAEAAAVALLLGGSAEGAARAAAVFTRLGPRSRRIVRDAYEQATAFVSQRHLETGAIHRWVANANAAARIPDRSGRASWAAKLLASQLRDRDVDTGPHSLTRPVLRYRLLEQAREQGSVAAIQVLALMQEQGALLALADAGVTVGVGRERSAR